MKLQLLCCLTIVVLILLPVLALAQIYWIEAPEFAPPHHADPEFGDLDGDGDYDLLYPQPLQAYENVGSATFPVWELNNVFVEGLPAASFMAACLADLDADGDLDFSAGDGPGNLYYYENVGTAFDPVWEEHNEMYPYLGEHFQANPELVDLDADGDLDLVLADASRFFFSYRNVGSPELPVWEEDASLCDDIDMPGGCIDPSFSDVDSDGDLDLIAGNRDMNWGMVAFENMGTEHDPAWLENMDLLIGVNTDVNGLGLDLADLNDDGAPDLLSSHLSEPSFYLNCGPITLVESTTSWSAIKAMFR